MKYCFKNNTLLSIRGKQKLPNVQLVPYNYNKISVSNSSLSLVVRWAETKIFPSCGWFFELEIYFGRKEHIFLKQRAYFHFKEECKQPRSHV